jgi:hypothetical protein
MTEARLVSWRRLTRADLRSKRSQSKPNWDEERLPHCSKLLPRFSAVNGTITVRNQLAVAGSRGCP